MDIRTDPYNRKASLLEKKLKQYLYMMEPMAMLGLIPTFLARYPINGIELPCRITFKLMVTVIKVRKYDELNMQENLMLSLIFKFLATAGFLNFT